MIPKMIQTIGEYVQKLIEVHNLDCYVIFNSDMHLSEYVGLKDQRVKLISGFEGSNATIVISKEPCIITDSRYYIQAQAQSKFPLYKETLTSYIALKEYKRISFDTRTISFQRFKGLLEKFAETGVEFINTNFEYVIEAEEASGTVINLEKYNLEEFLKYPNIRDFSIQEANLECENSNKNKLHNSGEGINPLIKKYLNSLGFENFKGNVTGSSYKTKISKIRSIIGDRILILTELDTICWILNLRGDDIDYNPIFYSYLVIDTESAILFCNKDISLDTVTIREYKEFEKYLSILENKSVIISGDCNQYIYSKLNNVEVTDRIRVLQAHKNEIELCGMALAYFFDGLALTELFAFIDNNDNFTEEDLAVKLDSIKRNFPGYVQESFETISSTGVNSAIVHHKASKELVDKNKIYLIDCGSHYYFGTTDTTRTLFFGKNLSDEIRHNYTLVLKGHISAMMKKYSIGSKYSEIDLVSRSFLKKENKDFGHATGHGVGHFLCVHEHPPVIHPNSTNEIESEHVFSVEPGYYKENEYGIRIENLVISRKTETGIALQNITLVPYQNIVVDEKILTKEEKDFYNQSNSNCRKFLKSFLSDGACKYLENSSGEIK